MLSPGSDIEPAPDRYDTARSATRQEPSTSRRCAVAGSAALPGHVTLTRGPHTARSSCAEASRNAKNPRISGGFDL